MNNYTNYYEILEVSENSTQDEIRKAYQNLILKYHPDKQNEINSDKYLLIDEAWKILRDPETRKIYNAEMLQTKFNENPIIFDSLVLSDFSYDEENDEYFYICRCGGVYIVPDELRDANTSDKCFISCDECSLVVQLIKES